jgi:phosphoglycolate phosphatase
LNVKAIIFDKDGTLMKFDSFWIEVTRRAVSDILIKLGRGDIPEDRILKALGVAGDRTDIDGLLCKGTYEQIALAIGGILKEAGIAVSDPDIVKMTVCAYNNNANAGKIEPSCENIRGVLERLKSIGIKLAVVTTDDHKITQKCLETLKIADLFETVYTDDGINPVKPDPWCASDFLKRFNIAAQNALIVGDTMTDMLFARNAGIRAIGVGKDSEARERLLPYAEAVIPDISYLTGIAEGE